MELTIHTYGHIDAMFYVLNGIAMLMGSNFAKLLIQTMSVIAISYYGIKMAYSGSSGRHREYMAKAAGMILMVNALLIPTTSMMVYDHVTKEYEKVDNLPYGFAVPVGYLESFGDLLTGGFEQVFTVPGNNNYRDYGLVFGARLVQQARDWRIQNLEFAGNMDRFIKRCIVTESMIGGRFTPEDLVQSDDIWTLVSTNAGTFRTVLMRDGKASEHMNCKEAAKLLANYFTDEINYLQSKYASSEFARAGREEDSKIPMGSIGQLNNMLKTNIELAYGSTLGTTETASTLIRQNMMINAISDYSNASDLYGYSRASMVQESSWRIAGNLASEYLPILLTVMKGIIYASFIFMVPMIILSGGGRRYLNYLTIVASLQLWPALNAIINMFIDLGSSKMLSSITGGIITHATYSEVGAEIDKIVAVASGLQLSIPFFAFALVQGGVGGFIHLASSITGATASAATQAAGEVTTGNRSLDNIAIGNYQQAQQIAHKTDLNSSYAEDASSWQQMDGTMEKVLASGQTILTGGAGMTASSGTVKFDLASSTHNQLSEGLSTTQSLLQSDQRLFDQAKSNMETNTADYVSHIAEREAGGHVFNYEELGEQGKSLQQAVNQVHALRQQNGYSYRQNAESIVRASASGSTPFKPITGIGLSGSIEGSVGASNSSEQSLTDENNLNRENNTNVNYNNLVKAANSESWSKDSSIDKGYSDSIRSSYEEVTRLENSISMRKEQVENYNQALSKVNSDGGTHSRDLYHIVEQRLQDIYGVSQKDAHNMIEAGDTRATNAWQQIVGENVESVMSEINTGRNNISGEHVDKTLDNFTENYKNQINQNPRDTVKNIALNNGLNPNKVQDYLQKRNNELQQRSNQLINENAVQYKSVKWHNETEMRDIQKQADKYEEKRQLLNPGGTIGGGAPPKLHKKN